MKFVFHPIPRKIILNFSTHHKRVRHFNNKGLLFRAWLQLPILPLKFFIFIFYHMIHHQNISSFPYRHAKLILKNIFYKSIDHFTLIFTTIRICLYDYLSNRSKALAYWIAVEILILRLLVKRSTVNLIRILYNKLYITDLLYLLNFEHATLKYLSSWQPENIC